MKFFDHITQFQCAKRRGFRGEPKEFYTCVIQKLRNWHKDAEEFTDMIIGVSELSWYRDIRPYYKVWPTIVQPLARLSLDVSMKDMNISERTVCLRMVDHPQTASVVGPISSILMSYTNVPTINRLFGGRELFDDYENAMLIIKMFMNDDHFKLFLFGSDTDCTIEETLSRYLFVMEEQRLAVKIGFSSLLMADDPDIIEPDVLNRDQAAYDRTGDNKYIDRAKRRGKHGWHIGRKMESMPHYRRPHLGLRWTGKGRAVPRIVPIKGAVVHRSRLTEVPTGYILPSGKEIEPRCE